MHCMNCGIEVTLDIHGRCGKCGSEAVVPMNHIAKPVDVREREVRMDIVYQIADFRKAMRTRS